MHFSPKIWEEMGVHPINNCSLPGSLGWGRDSSGAGSQEAGTGPHFLLQIFFPCFPPLKPRCVLWSGASYSLKNMVGFENDLDHPGWCGSVDWVPAWTCKWKGHWSDSWAGHMPTSRARSLVGVCATNQCFSHTSIFLFLSFSLPPPLSKNN